jgi:putative membrane protein
MIDDHTAANNALKATADQAGYGSAVATGLDDKHQDMLDKLAKKDTNDDDFDKAFYRAQEKAHKEAVSLFKDYSKDGDNAMLKTFASNTLPTLESHEKAANDLEEKVEKAE